MGHTVEPGLGPLPTQLHEIGRAGNCVFPTEVGHAAVVQLYDLIFAVGGTLPRPRQQTVVLVASM
jgi:hypothetical protein